MPVKEKTPEEIKAEQEAKEKAKKTEEIRHAYSRVQAALGVVHTKLHEQDHFLGANSPVTLSAEQYNELKAKLAEAGREFAKAFKAYLQLI